MLTLTSGTSSCWRSLTVLAMMTALVALAQDKPPAERPPDGQVGGLHFVDASEVTIVNVDVSVSDRNGPVHGLTPADFEVFQDGKPQEITNFFLFTPAIATPVPTSAAKPVAELPTPPVTSFPALRREPRFLAIYIDNENVMPFNRNRVVNRLSEFVQTRMQAPDQAMVVSYQKSMKILQPFTSDPIEITDALRRVKTYTGGMTDVNSTRRDVEEGIREDAEGNRGIERPLARVRGFAEEQHNNLTFTVRAIQELVIMMSGLPGKKAIMYVSDGLPMCPGLELYYELQEQFSNAGVLTSSREFDSTDLFRSLVTSASAAGVTMYTLDARGLQSESGIEAENRQSRSPIGATITQSNYQDSLIYMAEQTGGLAVINSNDVGPALERIANDFETYYSLGYRLVPSGQDRVHRIDVRLKGHAGYRLNFRRSFIEKTLPTRIGDRVVSALAFDIDDNPLGIELMSGEPSPASNGRWLLPVEVHVPIAKIALVADGATLVGNLMVYYAARDDEGKQSDLQRSEHPLKMAATEYEEAKRQYFTVTASLLLEPGNYRISVGVRDQLTNQAGYATVRRAVHPEQKE